MSVLYHWMDRFLPYIPEWSRHTDKGQMSNVFVSACNKVSHLHRLYWFVLTCFVYEWWRMFQSTSNHSVFVLVWTKTTLNRDSLPLRIRWGRLRYNELQPFLASLWRNKLFQFPLHGVSWVFCFYSYDALKKECNSTKGFALILLLILFFKFIYIKKEKVHTIWKEVEQENWPDMFLNVNVASESAAL